VKFIELLGTYTASATGSTLNLAKQSVMRILVVSQDLNVEYITYITFPKYTHVSKYLFRTVIY
jgi:hypothetical protein